MPGDGREREPRVATRVVVSERRRTVRALCEAEIPLLKLIFHEKERAYNTPKEKKNFVLACVRACLFIFGASPVTVDHVNHGTGGLGDSSLFAGNTFFTVYFFSSLHICTLAVCSQPCTFPFFYKKKKRGKMLCCGFQGIPSRGISRKHLQYFNPALLYEK